MPLAPGAALIRERLAARRRELADECPETIDRAAAVLHELHERLWGRAAELAADHSPRYRRKQFAGERAMSISDLVYVLLHGGDDALPALERLAAAAGMSLVRLVRPEEGVPAINAALMRAVGELEAVYSEAMADGVLTPAERRELWERLCELADRLDAMRGALEEE